MNNKAPPAAAYIKQAFAGAQSELAAQVIEFALLSRVEFIVGSFEIGAGIDHPLIEPECIKVVRYIVMIGYRLAIAFDRVKFSPQVGRLSAIWAAQAAIRRTEQFPTNPEAR